MKDEVFVGDDAFLENRRKGLSRFINCIVAHPVIGKDELVGQFLTEPSVSEWIENEP